VPFDRKAALKRAEKLLRQGKLERAIEEYVRLIEEQPHDWKAINALGDLYIRTGDVERGVAQFTRVADHLFGEGFFQRAAALYKKVLKVQSHYDHTLSQLADIAASQSLLVDAKAYLGQLGEIRQQRGDADGVAECRARVVALERRDMSPVPEAAAAPAPPVEDDPATPPPEWPELAGDTRKPKPLEVDLTDALGTVGQAAASPAADDAVSALEAAARNPHTRTKASADLGRLYVRRGDLLLGIEWLERAADGLATTPDEGFAVLYDLADALERLGEPARALAVLIELDVDAEGYRDVRARIDRLARAQTESPSR